MHKKDTGAICTDIHGDVDEFEAMSDLRGDRFFRLVDTSIDSTEHCIHTLIDTTPQSEMKDPRPGTAIQSSTTVTHFTPVENYSTTQSTMTAVETQPSTRRQQCTEFTGKHEPVCSAPSMTVPYDNLPYNDIPYNNSPYDDTPYDDSPHTISTLKLLKTRLYVSSFLHAFIPRDCHPPWWIAPAFRSGASML